ncbi:phage integrase SAM-like domain-containing protein [uncultured Sunxiuqinia sp.]|uniref:phage integrase SAM-like domain-containing protein n=1 Tax=uncultured Sunxiuqinia sp. TaxID=1573825 RepID=UPI002603B6D9|nr:phage integrase SAM-like domain-containing protein [uncultured Sunxiuqinia sp.]
MATIKYFLQSRKENATIYVRFSIDRSNVFKRRTNYFIDPGNWSTSKGMPIPRDNEKLKVLKRDLEKLSTLIQDNYNVDVKEGPIDGDWLERQVNAFQNKAEETETDRLLAAFNDYIAYLPFKLYSKNGIKVKGVAENTIKKYKALKVKIEGFQAHKGKQFKVKDVGLDFVAQFEKYLAEEEKLNTNSIGRYVKALKTVCLYANKYKYVETHKQVNEIQGYAEKVTPIYLDFDEIEQIKNATFKREALDNTRDWLIIGCFIGQRVSDLLRLTRLNVQNRNGLEVIELEQQKTGKKVAIAMPPQVKEILDKRNGNFPRAISDVKFNLHIKDVAKEAGITKITKGGWNDKETNRKIQGAYPKWMLLSSHVCRRSFATNFYGDIPTSILKDITAHSTEKQFLEYIGKSSPDYLEQQADYWTKLAKQREENKTKVRKLVN